jgi:uncharacterized lipoprotein YddW (UPF0748 family)
MWHLAKRLFSVVTLSFISMVLLSQADPKREFRAVWIATVENIDWPSQPGLTVEKQKQELKDILDLVKAYNMNTVVLQIRPASDAFYQSPVEPWSQWLTGMQGGAPEPFYDPLEFAIDESRKRGLDIHVWLNPYRALKDTSMHKIADNHISKIHPEWLVTYGSTKYFDPGIPEVRDYFAHIVSDIVRRYDIDAVHLDDYFYPYRIEGVEFPDDNSFTRYGGVYSDSRRDEWRRNNVNLIIKQVHDSIKSIKSFVEFGISPFGVWRNASVDSAGSDTRAGQTNYDDLYADVIYWQKEGWVDYVAPQLYWNIGFQAADYKTLAEWWNRNAFGCQLYIGHGIYRLDAESKTESWRSSDEIINQIRLNRTLGNIKGSLFYSAKFLAANPLDLKGALTRELYCYQAVQPVNNRIAIVNADKPSDAHLKRGLFKIKLTWEKGRNTKKFIIYRFRKGEKIDFSNPANIYKITSETGLVFRSGPASKLSKFGYAVTAFSQSNKESEAVFFLR